MEEFYQYRFEMYDRRRTDMIRRLNQELELLQNKHTFISDIISGKLQIFKKEKQKIVDILYDRGFKTYEEIYPKKGGEAVLQAGNNSDDSDSDENTNPKQGGQKQFKYLFNMNILSFSAEKLDKLSKEMQTVLGKLEALQNSTIEDLWLADLDQFESVYKEKCLKIPADAIQETRTAPLFRYNEPDSEEEETKHSMP